MALKREKLPETVGTKVPSLVKEARYNMYQFVKPLAEW